MNAAQALTGSIAANTVQKWLRAWHQGGMPDAIDLEIVRQMLPDTPYGHGVREIKTPMALGIDSCEGMLVRNPKDTAEWGIFYNGKASPERRRFTIAHELGHFILHRSQRQSFNCDKESVYSGIDTIRAIEREADDFASNPSLFLHRLTGPDTRSRKSPTCWPQHCCACAHVRTATPSKTASAFALASPANSA